MTRRRSPQTQIRRLRWMLRESAAILADIAAHPGSDRSAGDAAWWIKQIDQELRPRRAPSGKGDGKP